MDRATIEQMIRAGMPEADVKVSGEDGTQFEAVVISPVFEGMPTIKRHRMVYATLGSKMGNEIHALGLKTLAPAERS